MAAAEGLGWSPEEVALIRQVAEKHPQVWRTKEELDAYLAGRPYVPPEQLMGIKVTDRRAEASRQAAEFRATLEQQQRDGRGGYERWLPTENLSRPRMERYSSPYEPDPEPLEAPNKLSYQRIVRLEWECGLRAGDYWAWRADVDAAEEYERQLEEIRDRRGAARDQRVGRVGY